MKRKRYSVEQIVAAVRQHEQGVSATRVPKHRTRKRPNWTIWRLAIPDSRE